jgi:transcriptional regulator GlxA family with amidase domain
VSFHAGTGHTVSGYRRTLRARLALEHLRAGATNLARLAADTGFADHAHLTRTLKAEYGLPPRILPDVIVPSE